MVPKGKRGAADWWATAEEQCSGDGPKGVAARLGADSRSTL